MKIIASDATCVTTFAERLGMNKVAHWLSACLKARNWTVAELNRISKVSRRSIERAESGTFTPQLGTVHRLADAFGISRDAIDRYLDGRSMVLPLPPEHPDGIDPRAIVLNPIYDIDVSATVWVNVPIAELNTEDPQQRAILEDGRFELRIVVDCMEPSYPHGSIVRCRLIRTDLEMMPVNHAYVFCKNDGTATFKVLVKMQDDHFVLAAINQKKYPKPVKVAVDEIVRIAKAVGLVLPAPELNFKIRM